MNNKTTFSKTLNLITIVSLCTLSLGLSLLSSCKKSESIPAPDSVSNTILEKLKAAGFDTSEGLTKFQDGYIVENDIYLTEEAINRLNDSTFVKIPSKSSIEVNRKLRSKDPISHYVTNYLIGGGSTSQRNILVYMNPSFGTNLLSALDIAISRYNSLDLSVKFTKTSNSSLANIHFTAISSAPFLMSSGFPDAVGNPYNEIIINTSVYTSSANRTDAATSIAHEIGHAIGFRHTDYMNRTFSCGEGGNEGNTGGANWVVGTPSTPSTGSWMLACSNGGDRPFTVSDITALKGTYPLRKNIFVKEVLTFISDETTYDSESDHALVTWGVRAEFYQDANKTIPYVTSGQLLLNVVGTDAGSEYSTRILVPSGVSSYDLGLKIRDITYFQGQVTQDNSSGFYIVPFAGYYGPN